MTLKNLEKIGELKYEACSQKEFDGLVNSAKVRLKDASIQSLSLESRFDLAYNAVHSFALAALRWHGYRSNTRYIIFQCLDHTLNLEGHKCLILSNCHNKRNRAVYDGEFDVEEALLQALLKIAKELSEKLEEMGTVPPGSSNPS